METWTRYTEKDKVFALKSRMWRPSCSNEHKMEFDLENKQFICVICAEKTNLEKDYMDKYITTHNHHIIWTEEEQNLINKCLEKNIFEAVIPRKINDDIWNYFPELVSYYKDHPDCLLELRLAYSSDMGGFASEVRKKNEDAIFSINKRIQRMMWGKEKELNYPFFKINLHS